MKRDARRRDSSLVPNISSRWRSATSGASSPSARSDADGAATDERREHRRLIVAAAARTPPELAIERGEQERQVIRPEALVKAQDDLRCRAGAEPRRRVELLGRQRRIEQDVARLQHGQRQRDDGAAGLERLAAAGDAHALRPTIRPA